MNEPAVDTSSTTPRASAAPVVLRILLAVLLALPGLAGLIVYAWLAYEWVNEGFGFNQGDLWLMPLFVTGALCLTSFSVLTIGIVLRFARWEKAPLASLVLSIFSTIILVFGYQLLLDSFSLDARDDRQLSLVLSIAGLLIVSLPPLLHWWKAGKTG
jgi:hypothetical protein